MCSLRFPSLSLLSNQYKTVDPGGRFMDRYKYPACNILLISCWNCDSRWIGTGQQGVVWVAHLGQAVYNNLVLGIGQSLQRHWDTTVGFISLLVISLGPFSLTAGGCIASASAFLWASTCLFWTCKTSLVFFGWSAELVFRLALGGR